MTTTNSSPAIKQADYAYYDSTGYVCEYPVEHSDFVVGGEPNEDGKRRPEHANKAWCYHAARYRRMRLDDGVRAINWLCAAHYGRTRGPDDYNK